MMCIVCSTCTAACACHATVVAGLVRTVACVQAICVILWTSVVYVCDTVGFCIFLSGVQILMTVSNMMLQALQN